MLREGEKIVYEIKDSGLNPGKVKFQNEIFQNVYYPDIDDPTKIVYDPESGNIHLFPEQLDAAGKISKVIMGKLNNLAKNSLLKEYNPKKRGFNRVPVFDSFEKRSGLKYLYAFLSIEVNGVTFDLLPFCMETDKRIVNCEFGAYQFCIEVKKLKSCHLYPKKGDSRICMEDKEIYYTPNLDFESCDEEVIREFLNYVTRNVVG